MARGATEKIAVPAGTALLRVHVTGSRNTGAEPLFTPDALTEGTIVMLFAVPLVVRVTTEEPGSGASLTHAVVVLGARVSAVVEKFPFAPGIDPFVIVAPSMRNANPNCC